MRRYLDVMARGAPGAAIRCAAAHVVLTSVSAAFLFLGWTLFHDSSLMAAGLRRMRDVSLVAALPCAVYAWLAAKDALDGPTQFEHEPIPDLRMCLRHVAVHIMPFAFFSLVLVGAYSLTFASLLWMIRV